MHESKQTVLCKILFKFLYKLKEKNSCVKEFSMYVKFTQGITYLENISTV